MLDKFRLLRLGGALGCDSVCSAGDSVFEYARTSNPKFADGSPEIANARGYASRKST